MRKSTIIFIVIDVLAIFCFVLFYEKKEKFRNIIVNTAQGRRLASAVQGSMQGRWQKNFQKEEYHL